jgi:hydrogenase nickel incorporation protein HypA/HybF
MHELPAMKTIHEIVLKHAQAGNASRVLSVNLEIGALTDLQDEWIRRYFDHLSRGTIAEGAELFIARVPAVFLCSGCQGSFKVDSVMGEDLSCPRCDSYAVNAVSGRAIQVKDIEVM